MCGICSRLRDGVFMKRKQTDPKDSIFYREERRLGRPLYFYEKVKVILFWLLVICLLWWGAVILDSLELARYHDEIFEKEYTNIYSYKAPSAGRSLPALVFTDGSKDLFSAKCRSMTESLCRGLVSLSKKKQTEIFRVVVSGLKSKKENLASDRLYMAVIKEIELLDSSGKRVVLLNREFGHELSDAVKPPYERYFYFVWSYIVGLFVYIVLKIVQVYKSRGNQNE